VASSDTPAPRLGRAGGSRRNGLGCLILGIGNPDVQLRKTVEVEDIHEKKLTSVGFVGFLADWMPGVM
jgi:hypothetical protein